MWGQGIIDRIFAPSSAWTFPQEGEESAPEERANNYIDLGGGDASGSDSTDLALQNRDAVVSGSGAGRPEETAAVEFAVGLVSRSFMQATASPDLPALGPSMLSLAGRRVMLRGNAVFAIHNPRSGPLYLIPASGWDIVEGSWDPETWLYLLDLASPLGDYEQRVVPAAGVVHLRIGETAYPWQGVSPLVSAGITASQLARIEKSLQSEANTQVASLLPVPDGASDEQVKGLRNNIANAQGRVVTTETTAQGHGQGPMAAPREDLVAKRLGPNPPATSIQLRDASALAVISAMGTQPTLYSGEGAALRESYRIFLRSTIQAMGRKFEEELSKKLEMPVSLNFRRLAAADIAAPARAYGSLVQAGMPPERAEELSGINE